jgi:hypothetical protein
MNEQKNKDTRKKLGKQEDDSVYSSVMKSVKKLWDFVNHKSFWYGLVTVGGFLSFKHLLFERILPITEI